MNKENANTLLAHTGRHPEDNFGFVNTPIYPSSTVLFPNLDVYDEAQKPGYTGYTYARHGNPTSRMLEETLGELEGGKSIVLSSGIAAVSTALLSHLSSGDHLLMVDSVYGPTRRLCEQELAKLGIETTYYNPMIGSNIKDLIKPNTKVVYTESPGSLTFEVQDIPAISEAAHQAGAVVMMDNSWATPLYFKALDKGVDVVIHSATKYIGGHSDLVMGVITCNDKTYSKVLNTFRNYGSSASAFDCFLAQRGLRTLPVRLKHHQESALKVAEWLKSRPEVTRVLHPALTEYPGHNLWKRDFTGSSGLFSFIIKPLERTALAKFLDGMELFKMGYSWGGFESLIIPPSPKSIRTATKWDDEGQLIRISCGLEDPSDLIKDLEGGFRRGYA